MILDLCALCYWDAKQLLIGYWGNTINHPLFFLIPAIEH